MKLFCVLLILNFSILMALEQSSKNEQEIKINILEKIIKSELIKKLFNKVGPIFEKLGPGVSTAVSILQNFLDDTDGKIDRMAADLGIVKSQLIEISEQIYHVSNRAMTEHDRSITMIKNERFVEILAAMSAKEEKLPAKISSYKNDKEKLGEEMNLFIREYENEDFESKLVQHLFLGFPNSKPLIKDIFDFSRKCQMDHMLPRGINSSTQKAVFDIAYFILSKILRSYALLEVMASFEVETSKPNQHLHSEYLEAKKNATLASFRAKLTEQLSLMKLNSEDDLDDFVDLNNAGSKFVKFKNVFQTFLEKEEVVSGTNSCKGKCRHYTNTTVTENGCNGAVRDCQQRNTAADDTEATFILIAQIFFFSAPVNNGRYMSPNFYLRQSPQVDRIYEGYNYAKEGWFGLGNEKSPLIQNHTGYGSGYVDCDICICTCDQLKSSITVRKFYTGKISAPNGYVVTGVRFAEKNQAIFLQTQIGRLLPLGFVDSSTVFWVDFPSNPHPGNFITINYDYNFTQRIFLSKSYKLGEDEVVTGVKLSFESEHGDVATLGIHLNVFGRKIVDYNSAKLDFIEQTAQRTKVTEPLSLNYFVGLLPNENKFTLRSEVSLYFNTSDLKTDAGQSFLPYFDASDISFDPPAPLKMIGLIHYTNHGKYAGYIRPVIKSLNYERFLHSIASEK